MLSFGHGSVCDALQGKPRFDHSLVDWLKTRPYPVIDMREHFAADFAETGMNVDTYLDRFYIGHHSPAGNFFTAGAIRNRIFDWLKSNSQ